MKLAWNTLIFLVWIFPLTARSQSRELSSRDRNSVGGGCEGCDLIYVDMPATVTSSTSMVSGGESGEKLEISGVVYQRDGKTPAEGIVLYLYQTAKSGLYEPAPNQSGEVRRHGRIRGWVKTDAKGRYKFSTIRPGNYPNSTIPAHIHPTIKEPGKNEYFIDDFVFSDDPYVDERYRARQAGRGGSGILSLKKENGTWVGKRNIVLGENIPNYR